MAVFEGEKTEKKIFDNLKSHFLNDNPNTIVYGFHCSEIYSLYHKLKNDEDLELFPLLKDEMSVKNPDLAKIKRDEVSEIYLFFDYDGHAPTASDDKLDEMLQLFNDETNQGKLYISYPMVEAIKHLKMTNDFKDTVVDAKQVDYKHLVSLNCESSLLNLTVLTLTQWHIIINEHCKKAGFIVNDIFEFPKSLIEQNIIFEKQKEKYIAKNYIAVLSAFPIFLADYYGYEKLKLKIDV